MAQWWAGVMVETFWMHNEGVATLSAQIDRARVAAEQAFEHVDRHSALTRASRGVLRNAFEAHEHAAGLVRETLGDLMERTQYVVDGIGASVLDHQTLEDETSQVFDTLASTLGRGADPPSFPSHGQMYPGARFSDLEEPTEVLRDPGIGQQPFWKFDPKFVSWFNPSSYVREPIRNITGLDPFEKVVSRLSGDWSAFERVLFVWVQIGQFSNRVGRNLARAAAELPVVWKGREAGAAQWYVHALANATTDFGQFCGQPVAQYRNAVQAARTFNELASEVLSELVTYGGLAAVASKVTRSPDPMMKAAGKAALVMFRARIVALVTRLDGHLSMFLDEIDRFTEAVVAMRFTRMKALVVQGSPQ